MQQQKVSFACPTCGKEFCQAPSLQKHMRVHTGARPYICDFEGCGKSFSQSSNLVRHKRIHTGEKPYVCKECQKAFTSGSNLKQHEQIHIKDGSRDQYMCSICSKRFLYVSSLKKHLQNLHAEAIDSDKTGRQWEEYCKIIKSCEGTINLTESFKGRDDSSMPLAGSEASSVVGKKHRRRRKNLLESSEEVYEVTQITQKTFLRDESHVQTTEMADSKSPPLSYTKESSIEPVKPQVEEAKRVPEPVTPPAPETVQESTETVQETCPVCVHCQDDQTDNSKTLEERIKDAIVSLPTCPTYPLDPSEHHHVHCEFCGHPMIVHGDHVDFIHDAELHFVNESGAVYPHKLEINDQNPTGCRPPFQYPWQANPISGALMTVPDENGMKREIMSGQPQEPWRQLPLYGSEIPSPIPLALSEPVYPTPGSYCIDGTDKQTNETQPRMEMCHQHSATCGHPRIIHGDHVDYLVNGRLHFPHDTHCDDHGPLQVIQGYCFFDNGS